jgi:hypothetical protein
MSKNNPQSSFLLLINGNRVSTSQRCLFNNISKAEFFLRYSLPRIIFFNLILLEFFFPMGSTIIPQIEINFKAITIEMLQLIDKETHFSVRDQKSKDLIGELQHIEIRQQSTNCRLKKKSHRVKSRWCLQRPKEAIRKNSFCENSFEKLTGSQILFQISSCSLNPDWRSRGGMKVDERRGA